MRRRCLNLLPPEVKAARARRRAVPRGVAAAALAAGLLGAAAGWLALEVRQREEAWRAWQARSPGARQGPAGGEGAGKSAGAPSADLASGLRTLAALRREVEAAEALVESERRRGPVPEMLAAADEAARAASVRLVRVEATHEGRVTAEGTAPSLRALASFVRRLRERGWRDLELGFPESFRGGVGFRLVVQGG